MGLYDALTAGDEMRAARLAARINKQGAQRANRTLRRAATEQRRGYNRVGRQLDTGFARAEQPFDVGTRDIRDVNVVQPYVRAYEGGDRILEQSGDRADTLLDRAGDQAIDYYQPLARTFGRGVDAYADAMGLGGAAGYERATDQFRTSPGYEFQVDQGLDALERRAAARGQLGSGNLSADTMEFMGGIADQEWDDYLANLSGYNALATDVAGRMGDIRTGIAGQRAANATDIAGLRSALGMDYASGRTGAELARAGALADMAARRADMRARGELAQGTLGQDYLSGLRDIRKQQAAGYTDSAQTIADILAQGEMAGSQAGMNQLAALLGIGEIGAEIFGAG